MTTPQAEPGASRASRSEVLWNTVVSPAGYILAVSYPLLALSTGARTLYQLFFRDDIAYYLPVILSGIAALCYLTAAIGFAYRRRWTWWLSVSVLGFETFMTLLIGGLSLAYPDLIGRTVWRRFGEDYGYFPLVQPLIGLVWLLWPLTMKSYGVLVDDDDKPVHAFEPRSAAETISPE